MLCQEIFDQPPNIKVVIDEIKQKLAVHGTTLQHQYKISHSAFATLQGTSHGAKVDNNKQKFLQNESEHKKRKALKLSKNSKRQKRECSCGRECTSGWDECYCSTPSAALADFEPQPDIITHIKDLREARPGLDRALKDHERRIKKKNISSVGAAYYGNLI